MNERNIDPPITPPGPGEFALRQRADAYWEEYWNIIEALAPYADGLFRESIGYLLDDMQENIRDQLSY